MTNPISKTNYVDCDNISETILDVQSSGGCDEPGAVVKHVQNGQMIEVFVIPVTLSNGPAVKPVKLTALPNTPATDVSLPATMHDATVREQSAVAAIGETRISMNRESELTSESVDDDESLFSNANLCQAQAEDPSTSPLIDWLTRSNERPDWNTVSGQSEEVRSYWAQWNSLVMSEGVIYLRFYAPDGNTRFLQLIVPASLRQEFVRQAHGGVTGGHFGIRRSQDQVMRRGYWVGWRRYVERFCKQCPVCNQVHRGEPPKQGQLKPLLANGPMDRLHIDLCGKFSRSDGNAWILTCVDAYTRFLIAVPIRDKSARTVAETLMNHVFGLWGMCRQLVSDLGPEFPNEIKNNCAVCCMYNS
jgi:Integrase zinc binding domain